MNKTLTFADPTEVINVFLRLFVFDDNFPSFCP